MPPNRPDPTSSAKDASAGQARPDMSLRGRRDAGDDPAVYRARLTGGEDIIDPQRWAGSMPAAQGIAPRVRLGRDRWFNLLWLLPLGDRKSVV